MKNLNFLTKLGGQAGSERGLTLASTVGSQEEFYVSGGNSRGAFTPADVCQTSSVRLNRFTAHRRGTMLKLISVLVFILTIGVGQMWGATATLDASCIASNASSYQDGPTTLTDKNGNQWKVAGYGATKETNVVIGKGGANYLETPKFSGNISSIAVTWSGNTSYYLALKTTTGTELEAKQNPSTATEKTFTVTGEYKQLRLVGRRSSGTSNAAATITKVVVTYGTSGGGTTYTVTYNNNSGSGTMTDSNSPYSSGATVTTLPNSFTRSNYIFTSWNTQAGGGGTAYAENATFSISANTTLYAQWFQSVLKDILTLSTTGVSGNSYADWSGKTSNSNAVYAGNSYKTNNSIQLRSTNNSGIITTTSGGKAKYVIIEWEGHTDADRTVDIYGKNNAYTAVSDLYGNSTAQGTLLGSIICGKSTVLAVSGNYAYIGIRSRSGAMYLSSVTIEWTPPLYIVTYDANGGSVTPGSHTQASAGASITLATPTRTGYTFNGWYTATTGGTKRGNAGAAYTPTADETVHAQWTAKTINLTLNKNNSDASGSSAGSGSIKYDGTTATISTAASRTGYTVEGYYSNEGCTAANKVLTNTGAVVNSTVSGYTTSGKWSRTTTPTTLYAKWTANTNTAYTVKHYKQQLDGSYSATPDDTDNETGTTGASVTPAVKSYTGFSAPNTQTTAILADGSLVVTYQYTRNSYALSWVTDGDALTGGYTSGDTKFGASITAPNTPTKTGYTFAGWDSDVAATMPASATTYTATWTANTNTAYTVEHYKQQLDGSYSETPDETESLKGTTGASVTPNRKSYTGFTAPSGSPVTILADGSLVVTYQYTRNSYNLAWDANGGDDFTGDYTAAGSIKYGATITAPSSPTKSGASFNGWSPAFTGTMPADDVTYQAQWTENKHTVTYDPNGATSGSVPASPTEYNHGATAYVLGNDGELAKTHYAFDGWNDGEKDYEEGEDFTVNADVTLYAKWACAEYVNVSKGTPEHGTFTVSAGSKYTCDGAVDVEVTDIEPATGYEFSAVTASSGSVNNTRVTFAQYASGSSTINVTFTAKHITVTWNANGGSVSPASSEYVYDGSTVSLPTPTRTGYDFDGWYTEAEGGSPIDNVGGANKPSADVEYYAHWNVKSYSVTWMISGTAWTTDGQSSVNYGSSVTDLPTPPDPADYCGQKFMGWTDATDGAYVHGTSNLYETASEFPNATGAQIFYAVFADYAE